MNWPGSEVGVKPSVGTVVGIGVSDGGINVGVNVGSGVDVVAGTDNCADNCPEAQLDKAKLKSKTNIMAVRFLLFMVLLHCYGRTRRFLKVSRITAYYQSPNDAHKKSSAKKSLFLGMSEN